MTLNGWAMLAGGALLLAVSAPAEDWANAAPSARAVGSVAYDERVTLAAAAGAALVAGSGAGP